MDKLKYIKLEQPDGSYSDSIPLAVDSDYVDVNGNTLTNELNNKATKTEVQAVASGSPAGVYATVAALTSADPDHSKIYVVTENGHWYYYNGGFWTDGGPYQASTFEENSIKSYLLENNDLGPWKTSFLENNSKNFFSCDNKSLGDIEIKFDFTNGKLSFLGLLEDYYATWGRVLLTKKYIKDSGDYTIRMFNYQGTKPDIYIYDEDSYKNSDWNNYLGCLTSGRMRS